MRKEEAAKNEELGRKIRQEDATFQNRTQVANQQFRNLRQEFNHENEKLLHAKKEQEVRLKHLQRE